MRTYRLVLVVATVLLASCRAVGPGQIEPSSSGAEQLPTAAASVANSGEPLPSEQGISEEEAIALASSRSADPDAEFIDAASGTVSDLDPSLAAPIVGLDREIWLVRFAGMYLPYCDETFETCTPQEGVERIVLDFYTGDWLLTRSDSG